MFINQLHGISLQHNISEQKSNTLGNFYITVASTLDKIQRLQYIFEIHKLALFVYPVLNFCNLVDISFFVFVFLFFSTYFWDLSLLSTDLLSEILLAKLHNLTIWIFKTIKNQLNSIIFFKVT